MNETLIAELARVDADQRRDLVRAARAQRYELVRTALRRVRAELLAAYSARRVAHLISDAVSGRRGGDSAFKSRIAAMLLQELGHLNDVPGADRIRQIIE